MVLGRIWRELPSEMAERIMTYVPPNEIACTVRLINRASAAQFGELKHRTVRLSQPTPHEAFAQRWGSAGAMRTLSLPQRRGLLHLTAASGVVANLELAASQAGCTLDDEIFRAAAAAGQMGSCEWLHQQGCPCDLEVLCAAARAGSLEMVRWLWELVCPEDFNLLDVLDAAAGVDDRAVVEWLEQQGVFKKIDEVEIVLTAAKYGHVGLMDRLLEQMEHTRPPVRLDDAPSSIGPDLFVAASKGCDLATLQRLYAAYQSAISIDKDETDRETHRASAVQVAASSLTPDWKAKVEWLASQGWVSEDTRFLVDKVPDMHDRLLWLHQRGYRICERQVPMAVEKGDVVALNWLLQLGLNVGMVGSRVYGYTTVDPDLKPFESRLPVLEALLEHGNRPNPNTLIRAAESGDIAVVRWMVQTLGSTVLPPSLEGLDCSRTTIEVLAFLRQCGCCWELPRRRGARARTSPEPPFGSAAGEASEELLEWMAANGCPMPVDGRPYERAAHCGNLAALDCLHRLGCQWPRSEINVRAVLRGDEAVVRWFRTHGHINDTDVDAARPGGPAARHLTRGVGAHSL